MFEMHAFTKKLHSSTQRQVCDDFWTWYRKLKLSLNSFGKELTEFIYKSKIQ